MAEHPMDRAYRLGATRIPHEIAINVCEDSNCGLPTGWSDYLDRDGDVWRLTDYMHDGDTVMLPCPGNLDLMLRRDAEIHFGPLIEKAAAQEPPR